MTKKMMILIHYRHCYCKLSSVSHTNCNCVNNYRGLMNLFVTKLKSRPFLLLATMVVTRSGRGGSSGGLTTVSGFTSSSFRKTRQSKTTVVARRSSIKNSKPSLVGSLAVSKETNATRSKRTKGKSEKKKKKKTPAATKDTAEATKRSKKQNTETEIEKFQTLAQDVEYSNEEGFAEKLSTIKESYFPSIKVESKSIDNGVETGTAVQDITEGSPMAKYMTAIGKTAVSNGN